jgi:cytidine deaminase
MKSKYFLIAKKMAMKAPSKFKVGALLVIGKNQYTAFNYKDDIEHKPAKYHITIHAEDAVISKAISNGERHRLHMAELYVYRITVFGMAMSRPCIYCQKEIEKWKIKKVYYTTQTGYERLK